MSTDELKKTPGANGFIRTLSMSICWICGFGFTPENRWLRRLLSLPVGWTMLLIGAWQVFS